MSDASKPPSSSRHHQNPNNTSSSSSSSSFYHSIATVSTAQICLSVGYAAAEPAALRSLSRIASLYLQTLATSASSLSLSAARTESNPLDVIRAIEDLSLNRGFTGASNPSTPLAKSPAVRDLIDFVDSIDEVPFPKKIIHRNDARVRVFGGLEEERGAHVPKWLPRFPVEWMREEKKRGREKERLRWEEKIDLGLDDPEESKVRVLTVNPCFSKYLPGERRRVRFKLGLGFSLKKGEKRKREFLLGDRGDDDDDAKNGRKISCSDRVTTLYNEDTAIRTWH